MLAVTLWPSLFAATITTGRADDFVRRAQEELRKRNLYFGDIDGAANRGTVGALKHYQERKRLAVTGEVDAETLRSLGIPAPNTGGSAPLQPDPWPQTPVLRSDVARRPPPDAEVVLPPPGALPATPTPAAELPATPTTGTVPVTAAPPAPVATPTSAVTPLSPEAARAYLEGYLRAGAANELREEMTYYAEEVNYFNRGRASRDYVRRDVSLYYKRWPERRFEILGPVSVAAGPGRGEFTVRFQLRYRYRKGASLAEGRTENVFTLRRGPSGSLRIVGLQEQRVR